MVDRQLLAQIIALGRYEGRSYDKFRRRPVADAVLDALSKVNVSGIDTPLAQEKFWRLINRAAQTAATYERCETPS